MISYEEALDIITTAAGDRAEKSYGSETVTLENAPGRILMSDIVADRDYPPFNRSAMDGFAFNFIDWQEGVTNFRIAEVIFAGQEAKTELKKGECYKIMTGAAVPASANCVVRREDTEEKNDAVEIFSQNLSLFQNIARKGEDAPEGALLVRAPAYCTPSIVSILASTGNATVRVRKMPEVAIFTTGDEVVNAGDPVSPVQIRNSNQPLLLAMLQKWNIAPVRTEHLADRKDAIRKSLAEAIHLDMIILSGGVSAGDADFVPEILKDLGVENLFYKVAIKPGKPIWCGKLPHGGIVFALPGNPFSCMVTFTLFVECYLHRLFFKGKKSTYILPISSSKFKKHSLTEFFPVKMSISPEAGISPIPFNGSGDIRAGLFADGLGIQPTDRKNLKKGDIIEFIPFK